MPFSSEPLIPPSPQFPVTPIQAPVQIPPQEGPISFFMKKKFIILAFFLVVGVIAALIMMFGTSFSDKDVVFELTGPKEASGGDLVTYAVKIRNGNNAPLSNLRLTLFYPSDSVIQEDDMLQSRTTDSFEIGTLDAQSSHDKEIRLYLVGSQGSVKAMRAVISFVPQGLASKVELSKDASTTISTLPVPLTVVAPPSVINGESIDYIVDYRNQSNSDLSDLKLSIKYPDGFVIKKQFPLPDTVLSIDRSNTWTLESLLRGDAGRITVTGTLSGREREGKMLSVTLQRKVGDDYIDFEKYEVSSVISAPILAVSMQVNNADDYVAHLGDTLSYSILIENNSNIDLSSLVLAAAIDGSMVDQSTIQSSGYYDGTTKTVSWNGSVVPEFKLFRAHQTVKVPLTFKLKKSFSSSNVSARDSLVGLTVLAQTDSVPLQLSGQLLTARGNIITRISSAPSFSHQLFINDPKFPAQGPFPPKVGQKTFYSVKWSVSNPTNELKGGIVTATLLPGVNWESGVRVQGMVISPTYDSRKQTISWNLGNIPGGIGATFPVLDAYFQISQTPSINQVGSPVDLITGVHFEASDSLTGEKFSFDPQDLNTRNVSDSRASGNVQE